MSTQAHTRKHCEFGTCERSELIGLNSTLLVALHSITELSYTHPKLSWKAWLIKADGIARDAIAKAEQH